MAEQIQPSDALYAGTLNERDVKMFASIGVHLDLLEEAHVGRVSDEEARDRFGIQGAVYKKMAGIIFPYHSHVTGHRVTARLRRDNPEIENGKPKDKYISAYGDGRHLYFPPDAREKLQEPNTPIVLVEAEKSVVALTAWARRTGTDVIPVGMGGCWGWRGRIGKTLGINGERVDVEGPLPDMAVCDARTVYVMLDSNAASNTKVQAARNALVRELVRRGCTVRLCHLPEEPGINGPDDYVGARGDDALAKVLDNARPTVATHEYGGGRFELTQNGVSYIGPDDKDGNPKPPVWICAPLHVVASTRNSKSSEWGRLLEWRDPDGIRHQWAMPIELLQGDGADVRRELAQQGLPISPGKLARDLLATYLQVWRVDERARCVNRLGWHGGVYVLPGEVVGHNGERVVFQNAGYVEPAFSVAGTVEEWRENVARLARGNSRLELAICIAFAGTLLELAGEDSGGFHLHGPSSSGKSTALKVGASVWGKPDHPDPYWRSWRMTTNGLEGLAALHNDGMLILDELSEADPREAGEAAYLLANGLGKARAARNGTARPSASWRLLFLSSGEETLSALMARAGQKPTVGQEIRLAEISADAGAGLGTFDELHGSANGATFSTAVKDAASRYHGATGAEWLRLVVRDKAKLDTVLRDGIRQFVAEFVPKGAAGQVERVARRFGLVAVAGEIATSYKLTGWNEGESITAVGKCFVAWLDGIGGTGNREERALLAQVRSFFGANGASRFQDTSIEDQRIINRAGFFRSASDGQREYLVLPGCFRGEVCAGFDPKSAAKILRERGWLLTGSDRATQKVRLPGMVPTWVYVFGARMWEGDEA
jgi:uncharacterized protein (DUF927 family)